MCHNFIRKKTSDRLYHQSFWWNNESHFQIFGISLSSGSILFLTYKVAMKNQMPLFLESNRQWECFIAKVTREIKWHLIITQQPIVERYCWPRAHFPPIIVDSKTSGNFKRLMIRALSDSRNVSVGPFTISARPAKPASLKHILFVYEDSNKEIDWLAASQQFSVYSNPGCWLYTHRQR